MGQGVKILVVDKELDAAATLIGQLGNGDAEVVFISQTARAINNIRNNGYHLIILGDKLLGGGDTYDVGLEIKQSNLNKHRPVVCIARNTTRVGKLMSLLRPYSHSLDVSNEAEVKTVASRINEHLQELAAAKE